MPQGKPTVLGVDADRARQAKLAGALNDGGLTYRFVTEHQKLANGLRRLSPDLLLVWGELDDDAVIRTLDALTQDVATAALPVIVAVQEARDADLVGAFRSSVVELLRQPIGGEHAKPILDLWRSLAGRTGTLSLAEGPAGITRLVDHLRRTRRSGLLSLGGGAQAAGWASFVRGKLERASFLHLSGPEALRAMARAAPAPVSFAEMAGPPGEGANVVIEVGGDEAEAPALAEVVVGELLPDRSPVPFEVSGGHRLPEPTEPPPQAEPPQAEPVRILLVDDEPTLLKMLSQRFQKDGYAVTTATNGVEGAALALQQSPDLIFADLQMPHLDGWGMLRTLREDFRTRELPVAFISSQEDFRDTLKKLGAGAQAYVSKGGRLDAIIASADTLLQPRRKLRRALEERTTHPFAIHPVGPQWLLHQLAALKVTGALAARDGWASYTLHFVDGVCAHASAVAGKHSAEGERAFNAFVATRAATGVLAWGPPPSAPRNLFLGTDVLVERACTTLNENEGRVREHVMRTATNVEVNQTLYAVYTQVAPAQWLEGARLVCEEHLAPKAIMERLDVSPIELEEMMKDLLRRGVITLRRAAA